MRTAPAWTLKLLLLPLLPLRALSCLLYLPQLTRYPLQSTLGFAPLGRPPHPGQRGCCRARGLPVCPGARSPPLSWAGALARPQAEQGAEAGVARSPCRRALLACSGRALPSAAAGLGSRAGAQRGGRAALCRLDPVLAASPRRGGCRAGRDLSRCPAPAARPPGDMAPAFGGWSRLLVPLCLLVLAQSLFSPFNLLLSAQYVTVEQLSGILGSLHAPAASPLGYAPPAPPSSSCVPPPPLPSLSSPSISAEVRARFASLFPCTLPGR